MRHLCRSCRIPARCAVTVGAIDVMAAEVVGGRGATIRHSYLSARIGSTRDARWAGDEAGAERDDREHHGRRGEDDRIPAFELIEQ
jgi:hypothetical protein